MGNSKPYSSSNYILVDSHLVRAMGMTAASLLSRIHYWLQKDKGGIIHDEVKFVYNTAIEWSRQIGVSARQVERAIAKLKNLGLLRIEKLARHKSIRTNHYAINYDALQRLVAFKNEVPLSEPSRHFVGMYNTKNTDKNYNKSTPLPKQTSPKIQQVTEIKIEKDAEINTPVRVSNTTVQDMITYWQQIFPNSTVKLDRDLARHLFAAFKLRFKSDMKLWRHYCQTLDSSSYLTSKDFNLRLDWAIKFKTIDRIKTGDLGVKIIAIPGETQQLEAEVIQEINDLEESEACKSRRMKLLKLYGVYAYNCWLRKARLFEEGERVCYQAETEYGQNFIENHFGRLIVSRPQELQLFADQRRLAFSRKISLDAQAQYNPVFHKA
ncbi:MAG: hypothetical protein K0M45_01540 [Candidatus Paracaedibacteraceae bacterium]|nr:hypothetical protein [Candidatus Paracaedibacteraceae bacterium]